MRSNQRFVVTSYVLFFITVRLTIFNYCAAVLAEPSIYSIECNEPQIDILISPMISRDKIREIELSWKVMNAEKGDWVALYNEDPIINPNAKALFKSYTNDLNWVRTGIQENRDFSKLPLHNSTCMGYWSAYWKRKDDHDTLITSSCLRTFPTWMGDIKSKIKDLKLRDLFIPGTHNSAAYLMAYYPFKETTYQKYVYNQDETIENQLAMGIRYLDIRIGVQKDTYWTYHGRAALQPLSEVLDQIKNFLDKTNEIVILDIHRFPVGFKDDTDHESFANYLVKECKDYMADNYRGWNTRLQDIWSNNKRLIVSYNSRSIIISSMRGLWPAVSHKWADTQSPESLYSYLKNFMNEHKPNYMWAAMAELTPNAWSLMRYRKGLREMADLINKDVTKWFRSDWGLYCNIVAVDFFRSTAIVPTAIRWNNCRGK